VSGTLDLWRPNEPTGVYVLCGEMTRTYDPVFFDATSVAGQRRDISRAERARRRAKSAAARKARKARS